MAKWTYLGGMGHKQFTTETLEETEQAIRELEQWMNRRPTSVLVRKRGEAEAVPLPEAEAVHRLRAGLLDEAEEIFVIPRMAGG